MEKLHPNNHRRPMIDQDAGRKVRTGQRLHRIYCELELNLRNKPRRRLKREKPEEPAVPEAPNLV